MEIKKQKSKYKSLSEWKMVCPEGYKNALQQGCIEELCKDFGWEIDKEILKKEEINIQDDFNIVKSYFELKEITNLLETNIAKFVGATKNDTAASRSRKYLKDLERKSINLRKDIQMQRKKNGVKGILI